MSKLRTKYRTIEFGDIDIHIRILRDNQQFQDDDDIAKNLGINSASWPLFGLIWPSSEVLANFMIDYEIEGKRILEVGCGIALASLVLNHRMANITATDYHPSVKSFLEHNTMINNNRDIPYTRTGWIDENDTLGKFDMIIGSDLLYESNHIELLSTFINNHAKESCEVIIVDPGRGNANKFTKKMTEFGYTNTREKPKNTDYLKDNFKGYILNYIK